MPGSRFHTEPVAVDWIAAVVAAADCGLDTVAVAVPHGHNNCLRFAARHSDYYCKNCHRSCRSLALYLYLSRKLFHHFRSD